MEINPLKYIAQLIIGLVCGIISILIIINQLLIDDNDQGDILEVLMNYFDQTGILLGIFFLLVFLIYTACAIVYGAIRIMEITITYFDILPIKPERVYLSTSLKLLNFILPGFFGSIVIFVNNNIMYFRFTQC